MLEATLRDEHRPRTATDVFAALSAVPTALLQPSHTDHPDRIPACVSLVATMRKLLCSLMHQQLHSEPEKPGDSRAASHSNSRLAVLMTAVQQSVTSLEAFKLRNAHHASNVPLGQQHDVQSVSTTSPLKKHQLHHLQAGLLLTLHQGSALLSASSEGDVSTCISEKAPSLIQHGDGPACVMQHPEWLQELVGGLGHLSQGLTKVSSPILQGSPYPDKTPTSHMHFVWEQYGVTHFNGRLVPGCCNLDCTNLGGVSEAALKTQLCTGCKRARYCSVGCQRAAWAEGGHSTMCGK